MPDQLINTIINEENQSRLIEIGKNLTVNDLIFILDSISKKKVGAEKLSPLLIGLPFQIFGQMLNLTANFSFDALKKEGFLEPIQHHLTLFANECLELVNSHQESINLLNQEAREINVKHLTFKTLENFYHKISLLIQKLQLFLKGIDRALAITWNTNRIDLIEKFSHIKEMNHNQVFKQIGFPKTETTMATGLFAFLDEILFKTYGPLEQRGGESLKDDDIAIEGLTQLGVWYLADYFDLGLLPGFKTKEDLTKLNPEQTQELFYVVQRNLEELGIGTVLDLKKAHIFSKDMLLEFIQRRLNR